MFTKLHFRIGTMNILVLRQAVPPTIYNKIAPMGVVRCKKEGMLLQPLWWRCVDCVIHHERDEREG